MGRAQDEALAFFARGYNCAEAVLLAVEKLRGLPSGAVSPAAAAFGAGMLRTGSVCGALTGALMALGLDEGPRDPGDREGHEAFLTRARALLDAFRDEFGAVECSRLTGYDLPAELPAFLADRERRERCRRFVGFAVEGLARE